MGTKIIEMIGPPGVGKTTLYDVLCAKWDPKYNWTFQEALLAPKPNMEDFKGWLVYQCKRKLGIKVHKHISSDFGLRFINDHFELSNFLWSLISKSNIYKEEDLDKRFRSVNNLFSDFCRYQALFETKSSKPCLICEGFLQKSFLTQVDKVEMHELVSRYIKLVPLPSVVIYITTRNTEIIVQRLLTRKKVLANHLGMNPQELLIDILKWYSLFDCILDSLRMNNVEVYTINAASSIKENVDQLQNILEVQNLIF